MAGRDTAGETVTDSQQAEPQHVEPVELSTDDQNPIGVAADEGAGRVSGMFGPLHALNRRLDLALQELASLPENAFIHVLRTKPGGALLAESGSALTESIRLLVGDTHEIASDRHPLEAINQSQHIEVHRAWMSACHGADRIGRATAEIVEDLVSLDEQATLRRGTYNVTLVDLVGVEGIDSIVVTITPAADIKSQRRESTPPPTGTKSFRLRVDMAGQIIGGTEPCLELLGYPLKSLMGTSISALIHPDDFDAAAEVWNAVVSDPNRSQTMRIRLLHDDGTWRWFFDTAWSNISDPDSPGVISEFHDIHAQVEAEQARQASELSFQSLAESLPVGVAVLDEDGRVHFTNHRLASILTEAGLIGHGQEQRMGGHPSTGLTVRWEELVSPAIAAEVGDLMRPGVGTAQQPASRQVDVVGKNGEIVHLLVQAVTVSSPTGSNVIVNLQDVSNEVTTSRAHSRLIRVVDKVDDAVLLVKADRDTRLVVYANNSAQRFVEEDFVGRSITAFMRDDLREHVESFIYPVIDAGKPWSGDLWMSDPQDEWHLMAVSVTPVVDSAGEATHVGITMREITAERAHEQELANQARHDQLTGLPNRLSLMEMLSITPELGKPEDLVAVLFIDIDNLKIVNDGLGHSAGDRLLVAVAEELRRRNTDDLVTRFGGDEFVVVATVADNDDALAMADSLLGAIMRTYVPGIATRITASIGVAVSRRSEIDGESLIRDADAAMYVAKRTGRARTALFDDRLRRRTQRRFQLEADLRAAIENNELYINLQPVVSIDTGVITGAEALCRWKNHSPADFIPIAEESGLIIPLGKEVMKLALDAAADIRTRTEMSRFDIAINISAIELDQPDFARRTLEVIEHSGIPPQDVVIELTETVLIDSRDEVTETLKRLRDAGVRLALDDFGVGYSSLPYLRQYPLDILKLDISYTQGIEYDQETLIIVDSMVSMAHRLGMTVIAEGVETEAQLRRIEDLGVRLVQGYLLAPPLAPKSIVGPFPQDNLNS